MGQFFLLHSEPSQGNKTSHPPFRIYPIAAQMVTKCRAVTTSTVKGQLSNIIANEYNRY